MEVKILEEKKNKLIFEIDGETNTIPNLLKETLWEDEHIKSAGYTQDHPLVEKVRFIVETDTSEEPKKAVSKAVKKIIKELEKLDGEAKSIK